MIKKLWAKNYRSLADVKLTFEPITVLVGHNGSGKSNLVDVLRFLYDSFLLGLDAAIVKRHGMSTLRRWSAKGRPPIGPEFPASQRLGLDHNRPERRAIERFSAICQTGISTRCSCLYIFQQNLVSITHKLPLGLFSNALAGLPTAWIQIALCDDQPRHKFGVERRQGNRNRATHAVPHERTIP